MLRHIALVLIVCLVPLGVDAAPATGERGMVATAHPLATEAGVEMLRAGGNAVDAAVAAAFTLAVVEPYSSGLGGGGFATLRIGPTLTFLDFREVAPALATPDMYVRQGKVSAALSRTGPLAAAVPGAVAGYLSLHERFGKLARAKVLAPAIKAARDGFVIDDEFRQALGYRLRSLQKDPEASRIFLMEGRSADHRQIPPLGHVVLQPELAWTLQQIADQGSAAFYRGAVAERLVQDMETRRGLISAADLAAYQVRERPPLLGSYLGHAIATAPLPSAGGAAVLTSLNILESLPRSSTWHDKTSLHLMIEAFKRAFADRQLLGDPAFVPDLTPRLIAKDRGPLLAHVIAEAATATPAREVPAGQGAQLPVTRVPPASKAGGGSHTTHLCVLDAAGDAVSLTTTVNSSWGAAIVARGTGVLWNNEMDDFASGAGAPNTYGIPGTSANAIAPGKIPLSSMAPTLIFAGPKPEGPIRMVVGSPGGPRIPTTVVQVILNHLFYGADIATAISLGRLHHQHLPDIVRLEPFAVDPETQGWLHERGHHLDIHEPWSNATAISVDPVTGVRTGAADPRGIGVARAE